METCPVRALPLHPRPLGFRQVQALRPAGQGAAVRRQPRQRHGRDDAPAQSQAGRYHTAARGEGVVVVLMMVIVVVIAVVTLTVTRW